MAKTHFNSSSEKEHQELAAELKALKDVITDLSDKIDRLSISTDAGKEKPRGQKRRVISGLATW